MMNHKATLILSLIAGLLSTAQAEFIETMNSNSLTKNLQTDYGVSGKGTDKDSTLLQKAIDEVSAQGGGWIDIPTGKYKLAGIELKSNVHLRIDKGATLYPYEGNASVTIIMFTMGGGASRIENTSIRGQGGAFTVKVPAFDYRLKFLVCQNVTYEGFAVHPPVIHAEDILMEDPGKWLRENNLYAEGNPLNEPADTWNPKKRN